MSVVVPTLLADGKLDECLEGLKQQSWQTFEVIVVDNSGRELARRHESPGRVKVISNRQNFGFAAAVNQGWKAARGEFVATLNDDAVPRARWLEELVHATEGRPEVGMCASQIRLAGTGVLDSAGMLICRDGSSKQRGHGARPELFDKTEEVLLPSACAALYRRSMLEDVGGFEESFFLYHEDTDLGLRARWRGWKCLYVPGAVVEHTYSGTAGRASALKAYLVERNRLFLVVRNFPWRDLVRAPFYSARRYWWHLVYMLRGEGAAGSFVESGNPGWKLPWLVMRAHAALLKSWPRLLADRRRILNRARLKSEEFSALLRQHSISPKEVAAL